MNSSAAVQMLGVSRSFGHRSPGGTLQRVLANDRVNLAVKAGSIHAVIGENGAGKSTAMNLISGLLPVDEGRILIWGKEIHASQRRVAVAMVHQHFMLSERETALDNLLLKLSRGFGPFKRLDRQQALKNALELASQYGLKVEWPSEVSTLPVGVLQRLEILKALSEGTKILILDEPTAVLTPSEIEEFFNTLRELRKQNYAIILVTHKLKEVMALSDEVTVLRKGQSVAHFLTSQTTLEQLATAMIGESHESSNKRTTHNAAAKTKIGSKPVLSLATQKMKLELFSGEVVGIAGVEGNGQSDLIRSILFPKEQLQSGDHYQLFGQDARFWSTDRIRSNSFGKVAWIPEDRQREALLLESSVEENFLLGLRRNRRYWSSRFPILKSSRLSSDLEQVRKKFDLRCKSVQEQACNLSGGNQQKLVVGRELWELPQILIAAQPTRGVDLLSIERIHRAILDAKNNGTAVLLISSELEELMKLSHRILVIYRGSFSAELFPQEASFDENQLGLAMGGVVQLSEGAAGRG